ncbi:hypothetical protein ACJIZ3_000095 [Penstemon smallii]|uniref:Uncharacterized protein n=1 Tax=Penstemon smallii TaxID=265156 RepID=A0ABD3RAF0_9LAMI
MPILEVEKELLAEGKFSSRIDVFAVSRGRNGKASVNDHTAKLIVSILRFFVKVIV